MGLKNNEKYTATKHFKDRLFERFGISKDRCMTYMKSVYPNLILDLERSAKITVDGVYVYQSRDLPMYVVVNANEHKLITVVEDPNKIEKDIFEEFDSEVEEQEPVNNESSEPEDLTTETELKLINQFDDFVDKLRYQYAKEVITDANPIFHKMSDLSNKIANGNATKKNIEHLKELKDLQKDLELLFKNIEFKNLDKHIKAVI